MIQLQSKQILIKKSHHARALVKRGKSKCKFVYELSWFSALFCRKKKDKDKSPKSDKSGKKKSKKKKSKENDEDEKAAEPEDPIPKVEDAQLEQRTLPFAYIPYRADRHVQEADIWDQSIWAEKHRWEKPLFPQLSVTNDVEHGEHPGLPHSFCPD